MTFERIPPPEPHLKMWRATYAGPFSLIVVFDPEDPSEEFVVSVKVPNADAPLDLGRFHSFYDAQVACESFMRMNRQ